MTLANFIRYALCATFALSSAALVHAQAVNSITDTTPSNAPAKLISMVAPAYPPEMRFWGVTGSGLLQLTVTDSGEVVSPKVIRSPHPAFEQAMVKSVLTGKFSPGQRNGVATSSQVQLPFTFRFEPSPTKGPLSRREPFYFPKQPGDALPPELRYDEPPKINLVASVVYPVELLRTDVTGSAKVAVALDDKGRPINVKIVSATHPDFGHATKAMIQAWEFSPAMKDKKAIANVFLFEQKFEWDERDAGVNRKTRELLSALASKSSAVVETDALDKRPKPLYQPQPQDPRLSVNSADPPAAVVVEFYIDHDGFVHLPRIVSAPDPELGWAAVTAVKRWVFEVPTVKGTPVFARRELALEFR